MSAARRGRAAVYTLLTALMVSGAVEGMCRIGYRLLYDEGYTLRHLESLAALPDRQSAVSARAGDGPYLGREILHPYVGYVRDTAHLETHGFPGDVPVVQPPDPNQLVVAVTGGSVAEELTPRLRELLEERVAASGSARRVVVIGLNLGGFKQPQQLIAVNYILSLGGTIDVVINIDGYNEIALPANDNYAKRTFPFYPRHWRHRLEVRSDDADWVGVGRVAYARSVLERVAAESQSHPLRHSAAFGLLQAYRLRRLAAEAVRAEEDLMRSSVAAFRLETHGPYERYASVEDLYADSAQVWRRGSTLLARLGEAVGFEYYHFLQPNQYVEGSKVLSEKERERAWAPGQAVAKHARDGYPHLLRTAPDLLRDGVRFHDATMLFQDETETLYRDVCCHLNETGVDLLARHVVERVATETEIKALRLGGRSRTAVLAD